MSNTRRLVFFSVPEADGFQYIADIIEFDLVDPTDENFEVAAWCDLSWPIDAASAMLERGPFEVPAPWRT